MGKLTRTVIVELRAQDNDPESCRLRRRANRGRPAERGSRSAARSRWVRESAEAWA